MIDLRFGYLFPWPFRLVAALGVFGAVAIIVPYPLWSLALLLVSVFVLVSSEGTEINLANNTFREYTSYLFIKSGKFSRVPPIEKIFITKGKESQQVHTAHTNHSATFESSVFNGYLKFSSGEKIHLLRYKKKDLVIQKLVPLSDGLKVDIVDHS